MRLNKWMLVGASAVAAGLLMLGSGYARSVVAQENDIPCDATPFVPTATVVIDQLDRIQSPSELHAASQRIECTATPTVQRLKTHTPTATPTEPPKTATPVPPTVAPTNTPKPVSGNESVSVKPPNTGSGSGASGGSLSIWLVALGGLAVVAGGGAVLTGMRRH